jgi:hypothetical protein
MKITPGQQYHHIIFIISLLLISFICLFGCHLETIEKDEIPIRITGLDNAKALVLVKNTNNSRDVIDEFDIMVLNSEYQYKPVKFINKSNEVIEFPILYLFSPVKGYVVLIRDSKAKYYESEEVSISTYLTLLELSTGKIYSLMSPIANEKLQLFLNSENENAWLSFGGMLLGDAPIKTWWYDENGDYDIYKWQNYTNVDKNKRLLYLVKTEITLGGVSEDLLPVGDSRYIEELICLDPHMKSQELIFRNSVAQNHSVELIDYFMDNEGNIYYSLDVEGEIANYLISTDGKLSIISTTPEIFLAFKQLTSNSRKFWYDLDGKIYYIFNDRNQEWSIHEFQDDGSGVSILTLPNSDTAKGLKDIVTTNNRFYVEYQENDEILLLHNYFSKDKIDFTPDSLELSVGELHMNEIINAVSINNNLFIFGNLSNGNKPTIFNINLTTKSVSSILGLDDFLITGIANLYRRIQVDVYSVSEQRRKILHLYPNGDWEVFMSDGMSNEEKFQSINLVELN